MNCSPSDLKDFFFGELAEADRGRVQTHLGECPECREEFERLRLTQAALHSLRDEEPPRRIAFVSDKVFEPRWWQKLWRSGPQLGFASAAMLAAAILVHGFARPPQMVNAPPQATAAVEARISAEVARRIEPAVRAAVAESEARQTQKTAELVSAASKRFELQREADRIALAESFTYFQKKYNIMQVASADLGARP